MPAWVEAIHRLHSPPYLERYLDGSNMLGLLITDQTMFAMNRLFAIVEDALNMH